MHRFHNALFLLAFVLTTAACGGGEAPPATGPTGVPTIPATGTVHTPDTLPNALVLALAAFAPKEKADAGGLPKPLPARLEFLVRRGGKWLVSSIEDPDSNVFHKAMYYRSENGTPGILTVGGTAAKVKLWTKGPDGLTARTIWEKDFGGEFSRMREIEIADLFGDGKPSMAVATHDQGVVGILRPDGRGGFEVSEIDHEKDTFVHEIEIGDLDGDGTLEVYATPSEPNRLDGTEQSGSVVRYVPARGEGRVVVADLEDRHAKEIYVGDVDGDGTDELYVSVEGKVRPGTQTLEYGVQIRRYDAGTDPKKGAVIADINDRLCRFLTAGDVDGDGTKEMVAAAFSSGLWMLRPGPDPRGRWRIESLDKGSGGFEHAAILTDLDGDGRDELYVASDKNKEVRRYVWQDGKPVRETIYTRPDESVFTWNIMPIPADLVP